MLLHDNDETLGVWKGKALICRLCLQRQGRSIEEVDTADFLTKKEVEEADKAYVCDECLQTLK